MVSPKRKKPVVDDPLDAYRKVRKPVPRPGVVHRDRRRKVAERDAKRQARTEETDEP